LTYFTENFSGGGYSPYFAYSIDGLEWISLNGGRPYKLDIKDMHILRCQDGKFRAFATLWPPHVLYTESDDLINWTAPKKIDFGFNVPPDPGDYTGGRIWEPKAYWDPFNEQYIVTMSVTYLPVSKPYFTTWAVTTKDFVTYSEPYQYYDPGFEQPGGPGGLSDSGIIDLTMIAHDGALYAFFKDERGDNHMDPTYKSIRMISAKHEDIANPSWSHYSDFLVDEHLIEGTVVFKDNKEEKWFLLYDRWPYNGEYGLAYSFDLSADKWTVLSRFEYEFPMGVRDGWVLSITQEELDALIEAYPPPDEMPPRLRKFNDDEYDYISYAGNWAFNRFWYEGEFLGDLHSTTTAGDSFEFTFYGVSVEFYVSKTPGSGSLEIYLDGVSHGEFSQVSEDSYEPMQLLFSAYGLGPDAVHTLKGIATSDAFTTVDAFFVYNK